MKLLTLLISIISLTYAGSIDDYADCEFLRGNGGSPVEATDPTKAY